MYSDKRLWALGSGQPFLNVRRAGRLCQRASCAGSMQEKRQWLRRGFLRKARSEVRSISFMDLEAPHDDVLTKKDQVNTAFLLHGSGR